MNVNELGVPVVFSESVGLARAVGIWPRKRILVGRDWMALPDDQRTAVLQHEARHCLALHLERRCVLLALAAAPCLIWLPWSILAPIFATVVLWELATWRARAHEFEADRHAATAGHGPALAKFLSRAPEVPSVFYPSHADRIAAIYSSSKGGTMFKRIMKTLSIAVLAIAMLVSSTLAQAGACCSSFSIFPDTTRNFSSSVLLPPAYTDAIVLVANVSQTQTIPTTPATWVVFSANCNFYASTGASAAVPGATTTNGSASMLNPAAWNVTGVTQITVIAPTACIVTLSFYI